MKRQYSLLALGALLALTTSCKKDHELVTLGAVINQPGKTYIDDNRYPCWHNGDQVYVNNATYSISSASGPSAEIVDVVSADAYRAIFPARLVTPGSDISYSAGIPVTLPSTQTYTIENGHQWVDAPMGAYITTGTSLQFYNLCSIVRVTVNNSTGSDLSIDRIILKTDNARLSGTGVATIEGTAESRISMDGTASHSVSLKIPSNSPITVAQTPVSFNIIVPGFSTDNVTITLYTTDGKYFELTKNNVALVHNTVTTVTLNVTELQEATHAELVNGPNFRHFPITATAVVFEYNSSVSSGTLLSTANSPYPIYGNLDGTVWRVSTTARMINANSNCSYMFDLGYDERNRLTSIDFGEGFNTSNVTVMSNMFGWCSGLTSLDLSNFNTSNVTDMSNMFLWCSGLTSLDLSNFNTSNVTDMRSMFGECSGLTSLDLSNFNTSNVTSMGTMFNMCSGLTILDLSNFNTSNVTDMSNIFGGCSGLTSLDLSNFNTSNVTDMSNMFGGCSGLTSLDLSNFNTSNVTDMSNMFGGCSGLTSLDLSNFNTSDVTDMRSMFGECSGLTSLDLSNFNTSNVEDMSSMFRGCSGLTSPDLSNFNTSNVTDMSLMFYECTSLTSLNFSNFNTSNVTSMSYLFSSCRSLTSLNLSNFNTSNVTDMSNMFSSCRSLTSLNLSNFNTSNVTSMSAMFDCCSGLTNLDISNFNTSNVTDMSGMFYVCSGLTSLNLSNFNMSQVTDKSCACRSLSTTSGHCTITCTESVQVALESGTDLPTSGVTFTWVRPSSSK